MESEHAAAAESTPPTRSTAPWGSGDIAWAILVVLLVLPVLVLFGHALVSRAHVSVTPAGFFSSVMLECVLLGAAWWFSVRKYHLGLADLGFGNFARGRGAPFTIAAVLGSLVIVSLYGAAIKALGMEDRIPPVAIFKDKDPLLVAAGVGVAAFLAPLTEETFFRGFVFAGLRKTIGPWWAALFSAALFALAHMSPYLYLPVFFVGLVFAWVYHKSGSLWYNVLAHCGYNSLISYIALTTQR